MARDYYDESKGKNPWSKKKKKNNQETSQKKTSSPSVSRKVTSSTYGGGTTGSNYATGIRRTSSGGGKNSGRSTGSTTSSTLQNNTPQPTYSQRRYQQTGSNYGKSQRQMHSGGVIPTQQRRNEPVTSNRRNTPVTSTSRQRNGVATTSREMMEQRKAEQEAQRKRTSTPADENRAFMQRQKSGILTAEDQRKVQEKTEHRREVLGNTGAAAKKGLYDAGSGYVQGIEDFSEMTASNKNVTTALAMKMGYDPVKDKDKIAELEKDRQRTAEQARAHRLALSEKQQQRQEEFDKRTKNATGFEKALYGASESGAGMLADIGIGAITGTGQAGALSSMFLRTYGSTRGQAEREGATENEDRLYAALQGLKEVGTELMFPGAGLAKGYVGKAGLPLADKIAANLTKNMGKRAGNLTGAGIRLFGGAVEENAEEGAGWLLDPWIKEMTYGRNVRKRSIQDELKRESDDLRMNIKSEEDAAYAATYLGSEDFMAQTVQQCMDAGLNEQKAAEVAAQMRDYLSASLSGDTEAMEDIQDELARTLSGKSLKDYISDLDMDELKETIASTSLLTLTTGLPGTISTTMRGAMVRDKLGDEGLKALANSATNFEDAIASARGKVAKERMDEGGNITDTQIMDLVQAQSEQVQKDTGRMEAKEQAADKRIKANGNVSPVLVRNRDGSVQGDEVITREFKKSEAEASEIIKNITSSKESESLSDTEVRDGAQAIAAFETGDFNIKDANELNFSNTAIRTAFEQKTGVDLSQYIVRDRRGDIDIPATNAATKDALFAMAADNLVRTSELETQNWMDKVKGETVAQITQRMGGQGSLALQAALDNYDERDRSTYLRTAMAADTIYQTGLNMDTDWENVRSDAVKAFRGVDENLLKDMYTAGRMDRMISESNTIGRSVKIGEKLSEMGEQNNVRGQVVVETAVPPKGTMIRTFSEIANNLNVEIHLVDDIVDKDGKILKGANGTYKNGVIYLNVTNGIESNVGYIFMHEVTHHIKEYAPEQYKELENLVRDRWFRFNPDQMQDEIGKTIDLYKRVANQTLTEEEALEEIIADACHEFINDPDFAREVAEEDPGLAKAMLNSIKSALRMLRQVLATGSIEQTHMKSLFSYLDILDEAERLWLNAYTEAARNKAAVGLIEWQDEANRHSIQARQTRSSITPQQDANYMDAVERGDMDTAQRMVDDAAKMAGYDTNVKLYHGTDAEFNIFESGGGQYGEGVYLTYDEDTANSYGSRTIAVYTKPLKVANYTDLGNVLGIEDLYDYWERVEGDVSMEDITDLEYHPESVDALIKAGYNAFEDEGNYGLVIFSNKTGGIDSMVKSADPVTYDDNGDVIPLSERFNKGSEDIRYSISGDNASLNGKPFAVGSASSLDGYIEETHTYAEAQASDWHHSFMFSNAQVEKIDNEENVFFWVDDDGTIQTMWRQDEAPANIVRAIQNQIDITPRYSLSETDSEGNTITEKEAEVLHDIGPDVRFSYTTETMQQAKATFRAGKGEFRGFKNEKSGRELRTELIEKNFPERQAKSIVAAIDSFMDSTAAFLTDKNGLRMKYQFIGWDDLENGTVSIRRDRNGKIRSVNFSAMKKNDEYPVNFDFSTVCNKRIHFTKVIEEIAKAHDAETGASVFSEIKLTPDNMWKINEALKAEGIDTACLGCFVESRRYHIDTFFQNVEDRWNKPVREARKKLGLPEEEYFNFSKSEVTGEEWSAADDNWGDYGRSKAFKGAPLARTQALMNEIVKSGDVDSPLLKLIKPSDLLTPEGFEGFRKLSNAKIDMVGQIKSMYGAGVPKEILGFTPYNSEIALLPKNYKKQPMEKYLKSIGGIRIQSFSDFMIEHVYDHFQLIADAAYRKLPIHAYTKVIAYARIFGLTGAKINMSVMFDVMNNKQWADTLGISEADANKYANQYQGLRFVTELPEDYQKAYDNADKDKKLKKKYDKYIANGDTEADARRKTADWAVRPYRPITLEGKTGYLTYLVSDADYVNEQYQRLYDQYISEGMSPREAERKANANKPFEQSINYREAKELQDQEGYKDNVGIIGVAFGDEHLRMMMEDENIRYIIPYHSSSLPVVVSTKTNLKVARDYSDRQNTYKAESWILNGESVSDLKSAYAKFKKEHKGEPYPAQAFFAQAFKNSLDAEFGSKVEGSNTGAFDVYKHLDEATDIHEVSEQYLEDCIDNNYIPVFPEFSGHPGYYKMLFDFMVADDDGVLHPQQNVRNNYPGVDVDAKAAAGETITDEDLSELKKAIEAGAKAQNDKLQRWEDHKDNVMNDLLSREGEHSITADSNLNSIRYGTEDYTNPKTGVGIEEDSKLSISPEMDAAYMDAVNSGNMDEAQRLVDEAAKMGGYTESLYHGTGEYFNVFKMGREGIHLGNMEQASQVSKQRYHDRSKSTRYTYDEILENFDKLNNEDKIKLAEAADRAKWLHTSALRDTPDFNTENFKDEDLKDYIKTIADEYGKHNIYPLGFELPTFDRKVGENLMHLYAKINNPFVIENDLLDWTPYYIAEVLLQRADGKTNMESRFEAYGGGTDLDISGSEFNPDDMGRMDLQRIAGGLVKGDQAWQLLDEVLYWNGGYDGIKYLNKYEGDKNSYSYIALNRNAVKSADTITYAEDGSVIPLSERFDPENDDIRYSLPTQDSDGNILTDGQMEFFKNSQARDEQGRLIPMYHVTPMGGFTIFESAFSFDETSFSFSNSLDFALNYSSEDSNPEDWETAAETRLGDNETEEELLGHYKVYLSMENPLIVTDDMFEDMSIYEWPAYAKSEGYDGVIHMDFDGEGGDIYQVFSSSQIKDTRNENPSENPDIRYSVADDDSTMNYMQSKAESTDELWSNDPVIAEGRVRYSMTKKDFINGVTNEWNPAWRTEGKVLKEESVKNDIRNIIMGAMRNSDTKARYRQEMVDETVKIARQAYNLFKSNKSAEAGNLLYDHALSIIENLEFFVDEDQTNFERYKELRDYLRHTKITVPDRSKRDIDYAGYRSRNFGRVLLGDGGIAPDQAWIELHELWPEFFTEDNKGDVQSIMESIEAALDATKPFAQAYSSEECMEFAADIAADLYEVIYYGEPMKSLADKYDEKAKAMKVRHAEAMREFKAQYDQKLKDLKAEMKQREKSKLEAQKERLTDKYESKIEDLKTKQGQKLREQKRKADFEIASLKQNREYNIQRLKAEKARAVEEEKEKRRQSDAERRYNRAHRQLYNRVLNEYNSLVSRLLKPSKDRTKNIPEQLRQPLAEMLAVFDLEKERSKELEEKYRIPTKTQLNFRQIKDALENVAKTEGASTEFEAYFNYINGQITAIADKMDAANTYTIDMLDNNDIEVIKDMLSGLDASIKNWHQLVIDGENYQAQQICDKVGEGAKEHESLYGKAKERDGGLVGFLDNIVNMGELTPIYFFRQLKGMYDMYRQIRKGFDDYVKNDKVIIDKIAKILAPYYNTNKKGQRVKGSAVEEWRHSESAETFDLTYGTITLTVAQRMSLYCLSKREAAKGHMLSDIGGVVASETTAGSRIHSVEEKAKGKIVENNPLSLTPADIDTIITSLTPEQIQVAEQLQELMSKDMSELGNETSMKLLGIKLYKETEYFPIKVQGDSRATQLEKLGVREKVRNPGFSNPLVENASNPIILDDIFTVVAGHCNEMNLYASYAVPLTNFMKVYNGSVMDEEKGRAVKVKSVIRQTYGNKAIEYIENFLDDINGNSFKRSGGLDDVLDKALGQAKKAAVFANLRVALQQPTAIIRAWAVMDVKYFNVKPSAEATREMFEHCPIALWKSWGYYDTHFGRDIEDIMIGADVSSKIDAVMSDIYGKLDNMTWGMIWQAVKNEIRDKHPNVEEGSQEFWDLCSERASFVFDTTQVVDSPLHRSNDMRSKNGLVKQLTSFQAEPTLSFNVLRQGIVDTIEASKKGNKPAATKALTRVALVWLAQAAFVAFAQSVVDALRRKGHKDADDDEDDALAWYEEIMKYFLRNLGHNFIEDVNPINNVYWVKDFLPPVINALLGEYVYGQQNLAYQWVNTLTNGITQVKKKIEKGDSYSKSWWDCLTELFGGVGYAFGIPVKTVMRGTKNAFHWFNKITGANVFADDGMNDSESVLDSLLLKLGYKKKDSDGESSGKSSKASDKEKEAEEKKAESKAVKKILKSGMKQGEKAIPKTEQQLLSEIEEKTIGYYGEDRDRRIWDIVSDGYTDYIENGDYGQINKIRNVIEKAGGNVQSFDNKVLKASKSAYKKMMVDDPTEDQIQAQQDVRNYLLEHGMTEAEISAEICYKSDTARDLKAAFRMGNEDYIVDELVTLLRAGITRDDIYKLYKYRNYGAKDYDGKYTQPEYRTSQGSYIWPTQGTITSHFGYRDAPTAGASSNHQAIDIGAPQGTPVVAADGGVVIEAGANGGYGNSVGIRHDDGTISYYNHLYTWGVKVGDKVSQGQQIGQVGSTGISTGPHLDFRLYKDGEYLDPEQYLQ